MIKELMLLPMFLVRALLEYADVLVVVGVISSGISAWCRTYLDMTLLANFTAMLVLWSSGVFSGLWIQGRRHKQSEEDRDSSEAYTGKYADQHGHNWKVSSTRGVRVEHDDGRESNGSVDDHGLLKVLFVSGNTTHTGRMNQRMKTDTIEWSNGSTWTRVN